MMAQKMLMLKQSIYEELNIECITTRLIEPFRDILEKTRCAFGLYSDTFMQSPLCIRDRCNSTDVEDREIVNDNGLPRMDIPTLRVNTLDDCFNNVEKVTYSLRKTIL